MQSKTIRSGIVLAAEVDDVEVDVELGSTTVCVCVVPPAVTAPPPAAPPPAGLPPEVGLGGAGGNGVDDGRLTLLVFRVVPNNPS